MAPNLKQIGKYDIVGLLGQGAMGVVYKGFDPIIQRDVAIKTIGVDQAAIEENDLVERFRREAQAAGNLNHPNIVAIYEYGQQQDRAFIAMEYVQGHTLADMLKQGDALDIDRIGQIVSQLLSALGHAHEQGVIHRDIKPANIMLTHDGAVKIMDFGIARVTSSTLTQAGTVLGSPGYMSPEQLLGKTVDHRSDIFSAGVVLYEMLTGQKAFAGDTMASVIQKVVRNELPPPSQLRATVLPAFDAVVARACAKSADKRYGRVTQMAREVSQAAGQRHGEMTMIQERRDAQDPNASVRPPQQSHRIWPWAAALLLLAAAGLTWWLRPGPDQAPQPALLSVGQTLQECDGCPPVVVLAPGEFMQGALASEANRQPSEGPRHLVRIDYPLAIGRREVTRAEFARFAADTGFTGDGCEIYDGQWRMDQRRSWQSPGFPQGDDHPATCVSWQDAHDFTRWLSAKTGETYRLPSASEWEYAARAGGQSAMVWGDRIDDGCQSANLADQSAGRRYPGWQVFACRDDFVHTAPVASLAPNAFGLHDMAGNVFEWVRDCWRSTYADAPADGSAWTSPGCSEAELRGGSWFSRPGFVRTAFRNHYQMDRRASSFGFRVVREIKPINMAQSD